MLKYTDAKAQPNGILILTGLSEAEFEQLVSPFEVVFDAWKHQWTTTGRERERQRNNAESTTISPLSEDRLLFILAYLRHLSSQEVHGYKFGLSQATARLWIRTLLPVLREALLALESSPFQEHNNLFARLINNPVFYALIQTTNSFNLDSVSSRRQLFSFDSVSDGSAPSIHVSRKISQSLIPSGGFEPTKTALNVGELFCGAGGFSLGFMLANHPLIRYRPLFAFDNDISSLRTYRRNARWLKENTTGLLDQDPGVFRRDLRHLNVSAVLRLCKMKSGELDLLIGGPPCQGFSSSNKTNKLEHKVRNNSLVGVFLNMVSEFRPKMFLMENVQGVRWTKPTDDMVLRVRSDDASDAQRFATVRDFLRAKAKSLGYMIWDGTLDAASFGVPQHRLRYFLFGIRLDLLAPQTQGISLDPYLDRCRALQHVTVDQAIGDLPVLQNGQAWAGGHYEPSESSYVKTLRSLLSNGELHDHYTTQHQDYVIQRYSQIPEGGNWESIRESMTTFNSQTIDNTHRNIYRRLQRNKPANTISHYRKSMIIHPSQDRGLSFREACRLQSFPDWFRFEGVRNDVQQQLANAVPPLMATSVAYAIAELFVTEQNRCRLETSREAISLGADLELA